LRQGFWWTVESKWIVLSRRDINQWINLWPDLEHECARCGVVYDRNKMMMQRTTLIAAASGTVLMTSMSGQRIAGQIVGNDTFAVESMKRMSAKQRHNSSYLDEYE
jgi:hypothetical protein